MFLCRTYIHIKDAVLKKTASLLFFLHKTLGVGLVNQDKLLQVLY
jgi:hypothetical protein